jgi:LIM domain kinase 1
MRISFATDIARALAYLHARRCIHRDLKGENLLVTENGRLKITDFGFARIAARSTEEMKRLTFCGTDSYMSPEILLGEAFDLPTDVFSMGVIFCEIASRKLADDYTFKRSAPTFTIDEAEVRRLASSGCPTKFISLALDCMQVIPSRRPAMRDVLERLREIELEVLSRPEESDVHVGSVKFATGNRRPPVAPRIPSFGMGVGKDIRTNGANNVGSSDEESDEDLIIDAIKSLDVKGELFRFRIAENIEILRIVNDKSASTQPLLNRSSENSNYSTTVIKSHSRQGTATSPPSLSSILTIRSPPQTPDVEALTQVSPPNNLPSSDSVLSIESYHTASSSMSSISSANATQGGSTIHAAPSTHIHRFTLIKLGAKKHGIDEVPKYRLNSEGPSSAGGEQNWSPFGFFFSSALAAKCDLCTKRLGRKPVLECDDCGLRCVVISRDSISCARH